MVKKFLFMESTVRRQPFPSSRAMDIADHVWWRTELPTQDHPWHSLRLRKMALHTDYSF